MGIVDLLLPPSCAGCGRYGSALCRACLGGFLPGSRPADRFVAADPAIVVGDSLELAVAAFVYEGSLRKALARLKYGGAGRLARPLAAAAAPFMASLLAHLDGAVLVPVPVHAERLRQRGYNQAALLAGELAQGLGVSAAHLLTRQRPTTQQHRLNRVARLANLRGAFALAAGARSPPSVLLVDDILTTSATLEACASVLRQAGARRVWGFAIAREI